MPVSILKPAGGSNSSSSSSSSTSIDEMRARKRVSFLLDDNEARTDTEVQDVEDLDPIPSSSYNQVCLGR